MTMIAERPAALPDPLAGEVYEDQASVLQPRRWTREEYYRLGDAGFFDDERVELLDGEIWALPPQKTPHFSAIRRATDVLEELFGEGFEFRQQAPMTLDDGTEPEPDILVVPGSWQDYEDHHPTPPEVRLLVEVSDSTLAKDRGKKAEDYARAGIAEYWIINLVDAQLEVCREPAVFQSGYGYKIRQVLLAGDSITPLFAPNASVAVADLLPARQTQE